MGIIDICAALAPVELHAAAGGELRAIVKRDRSKQAFKITLARDRVKDFAHAGGGFIRHLENQLKPGDALRQSEEHFTGAGLLTNNTITFPMSELCAAIHSGRPDVDRPASLFFSALLNMLFPVAAKVFFRQVGIAQAIQQTATDIFIKAV